MKTTRKRYSFSGVYVRLDATIVHGRKSDAARWYDRLHCRWVVSAPSTLCSTQREGHTHTRARTRTHTPTVRHRGR